MDETVDNFDLAAVKSNRVLEDTDESLARRAWAGDETAFEQIFERHRQRVARIAGRFFNRPERVEEIVQEVFTKTYFALGDYSVQRGASFAAWLSRITINACYDHLRRARRRPESALDQITEIEVARLRARAFQPGDAESSLISRDLADKLLARLSAEDRLVLTLLEVEEMPVADISEVTGWSVSKVKVRAHRARAALRRVLDQFV
jgi:RNA polymerase sigma-70 factor (ECF subfamily)